MGRCLGNTVSSMLPRKHCACVAKETWYLICCQGNSVMGKLHMQLNANVMDLCGRGTVVQI